MTNHKTVSDALESGADPEMLCMTCPWDRFCITPPKMTRQQIEAEKVRSKTEDEAAMAKARTEGRDGGFPMGTLLTSLLYAGKDTAADLCPVLAVRLRTDEGQQIVQMIRCHMKGES